MKRTLRLVVCVAALFSLAACIEVSQEFTLNPDGSGKVAYRVLHVNQFGEEEAALASAIIDQLRDAKGVDAWSEVAARITKSGAVQFQGTAYFPDLNGLKLADADQIAFRWSEGRDGGIVVRVARNEAGNEAPRNTPITEAAIAAAVTAQRNRWKQSRAMAEALVLPLKWHSSFRLPAPTVEASGFELANPRTAALDFGGKAVMAALDELVSDSASMRRAALAGGDLLDFKNPKLPYEAVGLMFGQSGEVSVATAGPGEPLFDYGAEMSVAKAGHDAMIASLPNIGNAVARKLARVPPPPTGAGFKSLRVTAASYELQEVSTPPDFRTSIQIMGVLPSAATSVERGTLKTLITDGGLDLLPNAFGLSLTTWFGSEDRTTILIDVGFRLPDQPIRGFREISGVIPCKVLTETVSVDLGFTELVEGARGTRFDARITGVEPDGTGELIRIEIGLPNAEIEKFEFTDAQGEAIRSSLAFADSDRAVPSRNAFRIQGQIPRDARIIATIRKGKTYEIPFKIENVDLMGHAIK